MRVGRRLSRWSLRLPFLQMDGLRALFVGGRWSQSLPAQTRAALRWLLLDGVFASISDGIINTYQSVYLLALGASRGELGAMSALSNLAIPLAMWPGARLAARSAQYKRVVILPALLSRLLILGLILFPLFGPSPWLVYIGIGLVVVRAFLVQLFHPAWTALLGKLTPLHARGRYFSMRNIFMGAAGFLTLLCVGPLIDWLGEPTGYQWALGLALLSGLLATYMFNRIPETARPVPPRVPGQSRAFWRGLKAHPRFLAFSLISGVWNFSLQVAGPFFMVFLVEQVQAPAASIGLTGAAASLAALPGQRVFGMLNDRKGARWVQRLTGFMIPLVPAVWVMIRQPWQAYPIQIFSGFMWAGYNLAAFNLLLEMTPDEERSSFVALYQAVSGVCMAAGAAFGGWLAQTQGYSYVFFGSAGLRFLAALLFAALVAGSPQLGVPRLPKLPALPRLAWRARLHLVEEHLRYGLQLIRAWLHRALRLVRASVRGWLVLVGVRVRGWLAQRRRVIEEEGTQDEQHADGTTGVSRED